MHRSMKTSSLCWRVHTECAVCPSARDLLVSLLQKNLIQDRSIMVQTDRWVLQPRSSARSRRTENVMKRAAAEGQRGQMCPFRSDEVTNRRVSNERSRTGVDLKSALNKERELLAELTRPHQVHIKWNFIDSCRETCPRKETCPCSCRRTKGWI